MRSLSLSSEETIAKLIDGSEKSGRLQGYFDELSFRIGPGSCLDDRVLRAVCACRLGAPVELVSRHVDWRGFESLCAALLASIGYTVRRNVRFRRPRAEVDVLATGRSVTLLVDCKHWRRDPGVSSYAKMAEAQRKRAERVRSTLDTVSPIGIVIVTLGESQTRFVDGAAVVPIHTLADFSENVLAYSEQMTFS